MAQNNEKILFKNYYLILQSQSCDWWTYMSYFNFIPLFNIDKISINIHGHLLINYNHRLTVDTKAQKKQSMKTFGERIYDKLALHIVLRPLSVNCKLYILEISTIYNKLRYNCIYIYISIYIYIYKYLYLYIYRYISLIFLESRLLSIPHRTNLFLRNR